VFVLVILVVAAKAYSQAGKSEKSSPSNSSVQAFLGRWDLTLRAPGREYPSWLELREDAGQLKAEMVGRWGNARPRHEELPGPIYLQGSEKGHVAYRSIVITPAEKEQGARYDL